MLAEIERFLEHLKGRGRSENTRAAYGGDLRGFFGYLAASHPPVDQWPALDKSHVSGYARQLHAQGRAVSTIRRKLAAIGAFLDFLGHDVEIRKVETREIARQFEPSAEPDAPDNPNNPDALENSETISAEVLHALEAALARPIPARNPLTQLRDRLLVALLWETGATASEVAGLNVQDFDGEAGTLLLGGDGPRSRTAPLRGETADLLRAYLARRGQGAAPPDGDDPLIPNYLGQHLTRQGLWHVVRSWAVDAGIAQPITPRLLRRAAAMNLLRQGLDDKNLQDRLGLARSGAWRQQAQPPVLLLDGTTTTK